MVRRPSSSSPSRTNPLEGIVAPIRSRANERSEGARRAPDYRFPEGTFFGPGIAEVHQGVPSSDWEQWQRMGKMKVPLPPPSPRDLVYIDPLGMPGGRMREHLEKLKALGCNAVKFSAEWSRVAPAPGGPPDPAAIRLYRKLCTDCREFGIEPFFTLWHFATPAWANNVQDPRKGLGGWAGRHDDKPGEAPIVPEFVAHAGRMADALGDLVKYWIVLNEPMVAVFETFITGSYPGPGAGHYLEAYRAMINFAHAQTGACRAIHQRSPHAQVGLAQHIRVVRPLLPLRSHQAAADQLHYLLNQVFLDAVTKGTADWDTDGHFETVRDERLVEGIDWIGIQKYTDDTAAAVSPRLTRQILGVPADQYSPLELRGVPLEALLEDQLARIAPFTRNRTELGWRINPQTLYDAAMWAHERYGLDQVVTECGAADSTDLVRAPFLVQHVRTAQDAARDGARILGFLPWAMVHNNELGKAFLPFGLLETNAAGKVVPNRGGEALADIVAALGVTPELHRKWMSLRSGNAFLDSWRSSAHWRRW